MTDYRENQVDAVLDDYFAKRQAARAERVRAFLDSLNPRERALVQDVAVMGYVRGSMHPRPAVATIERCPGFPETCPNLVRVQPDPPHHGGGVRCGCADDPEDTEGTDQ
ncbi:hypothetical protein [Streptomyces olivaceoviridis]|uniref:hypothetical protein n=1 Tax=Streptomyces olivaceoviridis TaxID=1921 RepID=UPI0036FA69FB